MQISANNFSTGNFAPTTTVNSGASSNAHSVSDTVTLNLRPEQLGDKNIQAFLRQMAQNGTPIALNLAGIGGDDSSSNNQAAKFAQDAQISASQASSAANLASAAADRAAAIEARINQKSTTSAPPTYSEG